MINFFHDFIPDFASLCQPLFAMGSGTDPFAWTAEMQAAFEAVKLRMSAGTQLCFIDYNLPIILRTDASKVGVGGVLLQKVDGKERYIVFLSKAFSAVQSRWAVIEQEAYGVYFCTLAVANHVLG